MITLASTLREFQCDSSDPHCKYLHFLIDHIRHQASVKLQIILPTGSSRECQCCFSNSPPQGSVDPLFPSISVLLRASKCSSSKCFPKNLYNCIDRAGLLIQFWNRLKTWGGCYIQESDLSVVVIKDVHFDFPCDQRQCALSNSSSRDLHTAIRHTGIWCPSLNPLKTQWSGGSFLTKKFPTFFLQNMLQGLLIIVKGSA